MLLDKGTLLLTSFVAAAYHYRWASRNSGDRILNENVSTSGDRHLWMAVANLKKNSSREAIDAYMNALVNLTSALPCRTVGENIEIKFVRYPGLEGECLPVFTDELSWKAFLPALQDYNEIHHMPAVNVYRSVTEEMPDVNTVLIDPARPDFLRLPRSTIEMLANAQWTPQRKQE